MRYTKSDQQESRDWLLKMLHPGDTVYTVLRHVSRSGMQRRIDLYTIKDNRLVYLSGHAACIMGYTRSRDKEGIVVGGCGMDMGFHLVYNLSSELFPNGYESDEWDGHGQRTHKADGGYALKQEWI